MAELMRDFDRMAERLENLVNAQSRLLTDISHELRSPLARLNVALELARQRSGTEATSALDRIDRESNRLNELIQKLLTIARLESGDESIEKGPVRLDRLVQEIARDAAFEAQSRHCQVEAEIIDDCVVDWAARVCCTAPSRMLCATRSATPTKAPRSSCVWSGTLNSRRHRSQENCAAGIAPRN